MNGIRLHEDCFSRRDWTRVLTRAAADAILVIDLGNGELAVGAVAHGFRRTMLGTSPAVGFLRFNNAVFFHKMRFADLKYFFLLLTDRLNCASRAHLTAKSAIEITIAYGVVHSRLH